ncbi:MAG: 50S ribosomal protein L22 [Nitrospinae bacterium]|nr:50S ribosomal protein L22 [Nitrospinota bacterium]
MEATAVVRFARMSPQKARLVADLVRGRKVADALNILRFMNKATARIIGKVVASAKANAENKNVGNSDEMTIDRIFVDQGPVMKRRLARSRGRVDMIRKPFSHVTVVLKEAVREKKKAAPAKKGEAKAEAPAAEPKAGEKEAKAKTTGAKKAAAKPKAGAKGGAEAKTTKKKPKGK